MVLYRFCLDNNDTQKQNQIVVISWNRVGNSSKITHSSKGSDKINWNINYIII